MGRTYRRDDHHSWGKSIRDKRRRGMSERYVDDYELKPRKVRGKKKFDVNVNEYYEEDWF